MRSKRSKRSKQWHVRKDIEHTRRLIEQGLRPEPGFVHVSQYAQQAMAELVNRTLDNKALQVLGGGFVGSYASVRFRKYDPSKPT
jgi:hypothetical protein